MTVKTLQSALEAPQAETPWALTWVDLLSELRPKPEELNRLSSMVANIHDLLTNCSVSYSDVVIGHSFGHSTMLAGHRELYLYVMFDEFHPETYFDSHLNLIMEALKQYSPKQNGLSAQFVSENIDIRVFAAGTLYMGPTELLLTRPKEKSEWQDVRAVHIETTCAVLRARFMKAQSELFHDMCRVAKKWRASTDFLAAEDTPGDYLLELIMLHCVQAAPIMEVGDKLYSFIYRRFLTVLSGNATTSNVLPLDSAPRTFFSWEVYYPRSVLDESIARGLLEVGRTDLCSFVIVDPAVPFLNVARTVPDWGEMRHAARESLANFQSKELLESLQLRLVALSQGMTETVERLQEKIEALEVVELSPRRWSGNVQFTEAHINTDGWVLVMEIELRTIVWRLNARKARIENSGYGTVIDVSLQQMGKRLTRSFDVDVNFRSGISNLTFDDKVNHVLITKRSEVVRNRDYPLQITIVA